MNVNIFLKQFKCSHSEIISMIESGDMNTIGSERLRGLQKILPEADEVLFLNNGKVINMEITLFHDLKILINWICVVHCLEHVRLRFDINMIIISCLIKRDSRRVSISLRFCFKSYFSIFLKWCVNRLSFLPPLFAPCFDSSILLRHRSEHYHVDAISNTTIIDKLTYGLYSFESSMFNLKFHTVD